MNAFATLDDVLELTGKAYTSAEQERIEALLPLVSDALRYEAYKVDKNLDAMVDASGAYASVVKMVTVDVVCRVMRQTLDGDPMSQESQSAMGYSWSGTYSIPGGGMANAIMRNDLKRLGLRRQRIGSINMMGGEEVPEPPRPEPLPDDAYYIVGGLI